MSNNYVTLEGLIGRFDKWNFAKESWPEDVCWLKKQGRVPGVFEIKINKKLTENRPVLEEAIKIDSIYKIILDDYSILFLFDEDMPEKINNTSMEWRERIQNVYNGVVCSASMITEEKNLEKIKNEIEIYIKKSEENNTHWHKY